MSFASRQFMIKNHNIGVGFHPPKMDALIVKLIVIYVLYARVVIIKANLEESTMVIPLDPGPPSFQQLVPPSRASLPTTKPNDDGLLLSPRSQSDLNAFEAALASLPGQPIQVRKKFSNANPESLAIAQAARAMEWSRLFGMANQGTILL